MDSCTVAGLLLARFLWCRSNLPSNRRPDQTEPLLLSHSHRPEEIPCARCALTAGMGSPDGRVRSQRAMGTRLAHWGRPPPLPETPDAAIARAGRGPPHDADRSPAGTAGPRPGGQRLRVKYRNDATAELQPKPAHRPLPVTPSTALTSESSGVLCWGYGLNRSSTVGPSTRHTRHAFAGAQPRHVPGGRGAGGRCPVMFPEGFLSALNLWIR